MSILNKIKKLTLAVAVLIFASCDNSNFKADEIDDEIDDSKNIETEFDFCGCIKERDFDKLIDASNEFLNGLYDGKKKAEQQLRELTSWLISFPCIISSEILPITIFTEPSTIQVAFRMNENETEIRFVFNIVRDEMCYEPYKPFDPEIPSWITNEDGETVRLLPGDLVPAGFLRLTIVECREATEEQEEGMQITIRGCKWAISFIEGVEKYLSNDEVYVIKGKALEAYEYGRKIRFIEDFKGNFPKNVDSFMAWGAGYGYISESRINHIARDYEEGDILLMILTTYDKELAWYIGDFMANHPPDNTIVVFHEKPEDLRTIGCTCCVLKLSGENVIGRFVLKTPQIDYEISVPWSIFNENLQRVLKSKN